MTTETPARLAPGQLAPPFTLTASDGRRVRLWDYKQRRNLVLIFLSGQDTGVLDAVADRYAEYRDLEAEVLALLPLAAEQAQSLVPAGTLPFPLLLDPDAAVRRRYLGEQRSGVVIIDRFGTVYAIYGGETATDLPAQEEWLSWLRYIALQCPECGIGAWRSV